MPKPHTCPYAMLWRLWRWWLASGAVEFPSACSLAAKRKCKRLRNASAVGTNILNNDRFFVIFSGGTPKDDDYPFPWKKSLKRDASGSAPSETTAGSRKRNLDTVGLPSVRSQGVHLWTQRFADYVKRFPELQDLQNKLNEQFPGQIQFRLPRLGALSGSVVQHATNVIEELLLSQSPCTFKIGFTHCPLWRWGNKLYGYVTSKDKWSTMFILYLTPEPYSPSMLEAALIDKYKRPSLELYIYNFPHQRF